MQTEILFNPFGRPEYLEVNIARSSSDGVLKAAEGAEGRLLFTPIERPEPFQVLVARSEADEVGPSTESGQNRLLERLLRTRQRIQELRGAFRGLQEPPRASQTSGAGVYRRATAGSRPDSDFATKFTTVFGDTGSGTDAQLGFNGLSVDVLA